MSSIDIIRAWKDPEYRNSLNEEQRSQLPDNPAGMIDLSDEELESISGGCSINIEIPTIPSDNCCRVSKEISCLVART